MLQPLLARSLARKRALCAAGPEARVRACLDVTAAMRSRVRSRGPQARARSLTGPPLPQSVEAAQGQQQQQPPMPTARSAADSSKQQILFVRSLWRCSRERARTKMGPARTRNTRSLKSHQRWTADVGSLGPYARAPMPTLRGHWLVSAHHGPSLCVYVCVCVCVRAR